MRLLATRFRRNSRMARSDSSDSTGRDVAWLERLTMAGDTSRERFALWKCLNIFRVTRKKRLHIVN